MKAIKIFFVLILFAAIGLEVASFVIDEMTSANLESQLKSIAVPPNSTVDMTASKTAKLTGSGALEFYGGMLVKSQMPLGDLRSYYNTNKPADLADIQVVSLADSKEMLGAQFPKDLRFSQHDSAPDGYFVVYSFGEPQLPWTMFDYRSYIG